MPLAAPGRGKVPPPDGCRSAREKQARKCIGSTASRRASSPAAQGTLHKSINRLPSPATLTSSCCLGTCCLGTLGTSGIRNAMPVLWARRVRNLITILELSSAFRKMNTAA